jgi:3-oxoadipate enol-lactonase
MPKTVIHHNEIVYDDVGSGIPIICIHGHPFNRSMWKPQVEALKPYFRVITYDLCGYGESALHQLPTSFGDYGRDVGALMDALEIDSAVVIGLSMGGQIAFETWVQYSGRVKALVLADTFAQLDTPEVKANRIRTADRLVAEGIAGVAHELLPKMISAGTLANKPAVAEHVLEMMQTTPAMGAVTALRNRSERRDYTPYLPQISVPTLIVVGREDEFTPVSMAEFMRDRIPDAEMVVIEESGHMPNLEQPDVFNSELLEFLQILK